MSVIVTEFTPAFIMVSDTRARSLFADLPAPPLTDDVVVFVGRFTTISRRDAQRLAVELGAAVAGELSVETTVAVVGADSAASAGALTRLARLEIAEPGQVRRVSEDEFCALAGLPGPGVLRQQYALHRDLLAKHPSLCDAHLRALEQWGMIGPAVRARGGRYYRFGDVKVIREVGAELSAGASFRAVLRGRLQAQSGQLALDFRGDATPARVVELRRPDRPVAGGPEPTLPGLGNVDPRAAAQADALFQRASALDTGDEQTRAEAAEAYRAALALNPSLVPALINLANLDYAGDELAEAQALYERALSLEDDVFEAHFNLGNVYHDLGRFADARACYREALALNPAYADAHFYLAVTCEKMGLSEEARPHWRAYQQLAPDGEWADLAREFTTG